MADHRRTGLSRFARELVDPDALPFDEIDQAPALAAAVRWQLAGAEVLPPLGLLVAAVALFSHGLGFDAADAGWPDRDRLLLSADQELLLRPLLRLTGHADSTAPGEEPGDVALARTAHAGGLAVAVGTALAERVLATRFGRSLVDHRTYVLAGGPELTHGVSHEAASLAGMLRLDRLCVLWDASDAPPGALARGDGVEETLRRFVAYGWATRSIDGGDPAAVAAGLGMALRARRPTLLACRDGGERAFAAGPAALPSPPDPDTLRAWLVAGARGASARRSWLKRLAHHPRRAEFERAMARILPPTLPEALARVRETLASARAQTSTSQASESVIQALLPALPELVGLTADLGRCAVVPEPCVAVFPPRGTEGRWLALGAREQGLAAAVDGLAAHGGVLPVGVTLCPAGEALRPALWRAARLGLRAVHVLTCDGPEMREGGGGLGVDQLAGLRAVPNLLVLHPADALETAECWEIALGRADGPSLLVLSREPRPPLRLDAGRNCSELGGYVLAEAQGPRRASLIATGAAVGIAMAARSRLAAERIFVAVVSLPCWALFARAAAEYRAEVLGDAVRFGIEGGTGFGWERWLGDNGVFIGGGDEPVADVTAEVVAGRVRARLGG